MFSCRPSINNLYVTMCRRTVNEIEECYHVVRVRPRLEPTVKPRIGT